MTETTKTPNPLKQARRDKREAKAIKRFIEAYLEDHRGDMTDDERAVIHHMLGLASTRVEIANDALAILESDEVAK